MTQAIERKNYEIPATDKGEVLITPTDQSYKQIKKIPVETWVDDSSGLRLHYAHFYSPPVDIKAACIDEDITIERIRWQMVSLYQTANTTNASEVIKQFIELV